MCNTKHENPAPTPRKRDALTECTDRGARNRANTTKSCCEELMQCIGPRWRNPPEKHTKQQRSTVSSSLDGSERTVYANKKSRMASGGHKFHKHDDNVGRNMRARISRVDAPQTAKINAKHSVQLLVRHPKVPPRWWGGHRLHGDFAIY